MRILLPVALVLVVLGAACGGKSTPVAPTPMPAPIPACQANNTGTLTFRNAGSKTVDIILNGAKAETINAGETSSQRTVTCNGAQYLVDVIITNTTTHPCQTLLMTPIQCQNNAYATCVGF